MASSPTAAAGAQAIEDAHRVMRLALTAEETAFVANEVATLVVTLGADRTCDALTLLARGIAARREDRARG